MREGRCACTPTIFFIKKVLDRETQEALQNKRGGSGELHAIFFFCVAVN